MTKEGNALTYAASQGLKALNFVGKPLFKGVWGATKGVGKAGLGAANVAGRFAAKNPWKAAAVGGTGVALASDVPERFRSAASYSDPNQHFYTPSLITKRLKPMGNNLQINDHMRQQAKYYNRII